MSTPRHDSTDPESRPDRELRALRAWRDDGEQTGRFPAKIITDTHLKEIVRAGGSLYAVQNALEGPVRHLAEEVIQVQRAATAGAAGPAAGRSGRTAGPANAERTAPAAAPDISRLRSQVESLFAAVTTIPGRADVVGTVKSMPTPSGLRLRWPVSAVREPVVLHRIVARDDVAPWSPEAGMLVDIVVDISPDQTLAGSIDPRSPTSAVRHFAVFEHGGRNLDEAYESQPLLVATGTHVFGIADPEVREEDGLVIGRWAAPPDATRVLVFRIPLEQLARGAGQDPAFEIDADEPHLGGFVDGAATPGQRYRYDFVVEVDRDGALLHSDAASVEVEISAPLVPVTDLRVERRYADDGSALFDVSWTPPTAGEVLLFRTEKAPVAGAANDVHDRGVLAAQLGLRDDDQRRLPIVAFDDGRAGMRDIRGRAGWNRIHFTAVTVLNGQARVGRTTTLLVIGEPTEPEVVERCAHQVLKFGWPEGAAKVIVAPRGLADPVIVPTGGPGYDEIDKETYEKLGGLQFRTRLPRQGCAVHLAGVAFEGGDAEFGRPVSATYPGLTRLWYTIEARQRRFRLDRLVIRVGAEAEPTPLPAFVLVHRADRLPLHLSDGDPIPVVPDTPEVAQRSRLLRPVRLGADGSGPGWIAEVRGLTGFVRLFVDGASDRLALLDPPASSLRLGG